MDIEELKTWLEGFLRDLLANIAPQVSALVEADLTRSTGGIAQESQQYQIQKLATYTHDAVTSVVYGLEVLNNRLINLDSQVAAAYEGILSQMSIDRALTEPPAWYTVPPAITPTSDIASAVWSFALTLESPIAWEHLSLLENFARNVGFLAAFPLQGDPFLTVETSWKYPPD